MEIAQQFLERVKTGTGLRATVSLLNKVYNIGRSYAEGFKEHFKIVFDDYLQLERPRHAPNRMKSRSNSGSIP
jgi:hypothetical protein